MAEERLSICMVTTFYPPLHFGGDAMHAYRLTNELARRGHEVTVVHNADAYRALGGAEASGDFDAPPGVTMRPLETRFAKGSALTTYLTGRPARYASELESIFRRERFDVVHFHNVSLAGGPGVLRYGSGVKLYTMNEHWLVCPMHVLFRDNREPCVDPHCLRCTLAFRRPPQLWRYTGLLKRELRHVDLFLSPSRFTARAHAARGFERPIRHLPYFLSTREALPAPPIERERPYFLFAGRLERIKGVQVLIQAFRSYVDAELLIVGDGAYAHELRGQAAGLDHVHFFGRVHPSQLSGLYAGAVALLAPSVGYETFGIVVLEAFAQRTPAIVHDLGALPELIADAGGAGIAYSTLAELKDALRRMQADVSLRQELGERGHRAWRALWSEDAHMPAYFDAITEARRGRG